MCGVGKSAYEDGYMRSDVRSRKECGDGGMRRPGRVGGKECI